MKVLIVYWSKYGSAAWVARELVKALASPKVTLVDHYNLRLDKAARQKLDPQGYDLVLIGSGVYAGLIPGPLRRWVERRQEGLLAVKKLALYVCCMAEGEQARSYMLAALPPQISAKSCEIKVCGGRVDPAKMGGFDRFVMEKLAKLKEARDSRNALAVHELAELILDQGT